MPKLNSLIAMGRWVRAAVRRPKPVRVHHARALFLGVLALSLSVPALPAAACPYPDEGNMPLRRALTRVQMLPEMQAWDREHRDAGDSVQYRLDLERTHRVKGKCHWTVEALANGKVWRVFYVSPDGRSVLPVFR